jgi:hypothetical protein
MDTSAFEKALQFINVMKDGLPAAVHSIVVASGSKMHSRTLSNISMRSRTYFDYSYVYVTFVL